MHEKTPAGCTPLVFAFEHILQFGEHCLDSSVPVTKLTCYQPTNSKVGQSVPREAITKGTYSHPSSSFTFTANCSVVSVALPARKGRETKSSAAGTRRAVLRQVFTQEHVGVL
eukprot:1507443-Amphidinium_carterae.1